VVRTSEAKPSAIRDRGNEDVDGRVKPGHDGVVRTSEAKPSAIRDRGG
jgi:hypothetical protein